MCRVQRVERRSLAATSCLTCRLPSLVWCQSPEPLAAVVDRLGSQILTLVPCPSHDSSVACPPWAVAIACTIDRPSPLPPRAEKSGTAGPPPLDSAESARSDAR